jgi:hypothetical protein
MIVITNLMRSCLVAGSLVALCPLAALGSGPSGGGTINFGPGDITSDLYVTGQTTVNVNGSTVHWSYLHDHSVMNVTGNATMPWMLLYENSVANIHDGDISWLKLYGSSRANLTSVDELSWLLLNDQSQAHLYGSSFHYGGGHLSGKWANGTPFSFWTLNERSLSDPFSDRSIMPAGIHLHVVPEPTAGAVALGCLLFVVKRRRAGAARA